MNPGLLRRLGVLGLTVLVFVAVLGLGVVPFRDWLDQRETLGDLREQVAEIDRQNRDYELRVDALNTDEEAYAILPPPDEVVVIPGIWPFRG